MHATRLYLASEPEPRPESPMKQKREEFFAACPPATSRPPPRGLKTALQKTNPSHNHGKQHAKSTHPTATYLVVPADA